VWGTALDKRFVLFGVFLVVAPVLMTTELAFSSAPTPSVPEFTVKLVDKSYDVPTTYSTDPYTGDPVSQGGYHVTSRHIVVTIENQAFTPYVSDDWIHQLYYNIRVKGHYSESWRELYNPSDGYPNQTNSKHSTKSYLLGENCSTTLGNVMMDFPYGSQVDFQVQAMIGYCHRIQIPNATLTPLTFPWVFTGETSNWSETQTITINEPDSTVTLDLPNQQVFIIAGALILIPIAVGIGLLIHLSKKTAKVF
jgi:hypothetical protein